MEVCDDNTDGFGLFDLSLSNEEVLDGLDPSEFTITYYENAENAENAENPIITLFTQMLHLLIRPYGFVLRIIQLTVIILLQLS